MITQLILKDLRAYGFRMLLLFLGYLAIGGLFIFRFYQWHVFMMYGYLLISSLIAYFVLPEKFKNSEIMICSLPVTREMIVIAKFILTYIIIIAGLIIWFLNAYIFEFVFPNARTDFNQIFFPKVVFMALFFLILQSSLFLPSYFSMKKFGTIFMFIVSMVIAITSIPLLFNPYKYSFNPYFTQNDIPFVLILLFIVAFLHYLSIILSRKMYHKISF